MRAGSEAEEQNPRREKAARLSKLLAGGKVDRGAGRYLIGARAREADGLGGNFRDGKMKRKLLEVARVPLHH